MRKPSAKERRHQALIENGYETSGIHSDWTRRTKYVRYDPATGRILEAGTTSIGALRHNEREFGWHYVEVEGHWDTHYVLDGFVVRKKASPTVLDGLVLRSLPVPCQIEIRDETGDVQKYDCTDEELELEFDNPGTYRVRIKSVPFKDGYFEVLHEEA